MLQLDWLLARGKTVLKLAYSRKTFLKAHCISGDACRLLAYEFLQWPDLVVGAVLSSKSTESHVSYSKESRVLSTQLSTCVLAAGIVAS